ncbi:hypothetical protein Goari_002791 [Gossypium aridum]|uniref:Protein kinase domain-containing protein n=1 Tax=Gossypium aridum TaxID=34290 RepID=A0A7J8Y9I9_GOSAI|nr:hypothetical protein [Gossypium aridum]
MWDLKTGKLSDFSTRFAFSIDIQDASDYGHGFVFFLAAAGSQLQLNSRAGRLGLFNTSQWVSTLGQVVIVEFDTYKNGWDPTHLDNHVGINKNSIMSVVYTKWNARIHNRDIADVLITYNTTTRNLSASWSYHTTHNPQEVSSLSYLIDLKMALPEWVMVGFSATTSVSTKQHILQWWEFNSTLERDMETGGNISTNVKIVLGLVVPIAKTRKRRKPEAAENLTSINDALEKGTRPRKFSYVDLVTSTNNFSKQRKLAEGGFGAIYRGYLPDLDVVVACHDKGEFLLVSEFTPNGSLDFHLFVHRDIKSNNIMLDSSFNVKLGDFGLARLMDYELGPKTTGLAGTLGYLAPEYVNTG